VAVSFFICHASEDKATVARPIADLLRSKGFNVWYDEYSLTVGDGLREKIDDGLRRADFAIVILSRHFFRKRWPAAELSYCFHRQLAEGRKIILPVWHDVSQSEVAANAPLIVDLKAARTDSGPEGTVAEILRAAAQGDDGRAIQVELSELLSQRTLANMMDGASTIDSEEPESRTPEIRALDRRIAELNQRLSALVRQPRVAVPSDIHTWPLSRLCPYIRDVLDPEAVRRATDDYRRTDDDGDHSTVRQRADEILQGVAERHGFADGWRACLAQRGAKK